MIQEYALMWWLFDVAGHDQEDMEVHLVRYKPDAIDALCQSTKFTRKEIQLMYRGFKQVIYIKIMFSRGWRGKEEEEEEDVVSSYLMTWIEAINFIQAIKR